MTLKSKLFIPQRKIDIFIVLRDKGSPKKPSQCWHYATSCTTVKVLPRKSHEDPEEQQRYRSTPLLTSALGSWVVKATPRPLNPQERTVIHCIGGWVGPRAGLHECGKSRPLLEFDYRTVQPVLCSYTDYAIPAHGRPMNRSSIPGRNKKFSLLWCIQTYSGDHPANPMRTAVLLPGELQRSEREADHSPHPVSSLRVGVVPPFPHTSSQSAKNTTFLRDDSSRTSHVTPHVKGTDTTRKPS
jgi:hypothetical protein